MLQRDTHTFSPTAIHALSDRDRYISEGWLRLRSTSSECFLVILRTSSAYERTEIENHVWSRPMRRLYSMEYNTIQYKHDKRRRTSCRRTFGEATNPWVAPLMILCAFACRQRPLLGHGILMQLRDVHSSFGRTHSWVSEDWSHLREKIESWEETR